MAEKFKVDLIRMLTDSFALKAEEARELAMMPDYETVRAYMAEIIARFIDKDYERLTNILYRIDLRENAAKACFGHSAMQDVARCLADEIVKRMLKKIEYRKRGGY